MSCGHWLHFTYCKHNMHRFGATLELGPNFFAKNNYSPLPTTNLGCMMHQDMYCMASYVIAHTHLLVWVTSER